MNFYLAWADISSIKALLSHNKWNNFLKHITSPIAGRPEWRLNCAKMNEAKCTTQTPRGTSELIGLFMRCCLIAPRWILRSDRHDLVCTRSLLTLSDFEFYFLAITERCKAAWALYFRMMNEQILAAIVWCDETVTFVCIEPLHCTCTHAVFFLFKLGVRPQYTYLLILV